MRSFNNSGAGKRGRFLLRLMTCILALACTSPAFAATLAAWDVHSLAGGSNDFGPSPLAATASDPNLTVGGLTRGAGVGTTGTAAARAWGGNGWNSASAAAAATANKYATCTVAANSGKQVSFTSISKLDYRRSSSGATSGVLQYQVGAGAFTDITTLTYSSTSSSGASLPAIDLSAIPALQNVQAGTTVTFRIVNYGGSSSTGTWYLFDTANSSASDFEIQGTVADGQGSQNYTLTTATAGNGSGAITGVVNPYAAGSTATITATPGGDSAFSGWSGCSTSLEATIDVVMDSNTSCTANFTATAASLTIFHVNDTHARLTPHKMVAPNHGTGSHQFEDVGGAAYLAAKMLELTAQQPNSLVIDAGDISEGNPIGDMNGNGSMTEFYALLSDKLESQRGRGMDAVVVGNHDVRDVNYVNNLIALKNSGVPVLSVNVRDKNTHQPYFAGTNVVTVNGRKVGIIGYTIHTAEVGATLANTIEVVPCAWSGNATCNIADYVNDLRNNQGADIVVLAAHIGHSALVDPAAPLLADNGVAKLPEVVVTGHWHTWADTPAWQPESLNYKTIFTEANSYMKYIGELQVTATGGYFRAANHLIRNADITPDPDVQSFVSGLIAQYNAAHPGHPVDEVIGYTADDLLLDNEMRWWSANEYPWSGNNTAGQWICDALRWKGEQLFGQSDLAIETGGGVRADIPAGPVTYSQIYETFPWYDDTFYRINMTGQEIVSFLKETNMNAGFSSALEVTAYDGVPTDVRFNGQPIDLNHTYTVTINNYMYAHPPTGWTWSDTNPLTSSELCREGIVDYMRQFTAENPYHIGGPRYHLNTEHSGGYRAVVTMMNDNDTEPAYEGAFIRLLAVTPETLARRGTPQVPADLVNADGTINPLHHLAEHELYRSFLGFKNGVLQPGDIIEVWGKGSAYGGNPEFVDQEGIQADGVEFKVVGHDASLAKPLFMSSINALWDDLHKNHYVRFLAKKASANTVTDQNGQTIKLWDATGYASMTLPGNVNDTLLISGVPTMEFFGLRFRCNSATLSATSLPAASVISSHVEPTPAGTTDSPLTLTATASTSDGTYLLSPVADSQVASGYPSSNYGTSTNLYLQSDDSGYGNERGWLRFDLSGLPADATIAGATLKLWNWKVTGPAMAAEVRGGSDDTWSESGINWSNQPVYGSALDTQTLDPASTNLWYQWDVSSFVQGEWSGNKLVSLVVKPATEGSTATPAPSYAFDSKEYGSNGPVLEVNTQTSGATISQVDFYSRYSADNASWVLWTLYSSSTEAPFTTSFTYPQGQGYYEFYSRATDSNGNLEPAPTGAQAATRYTTTPAYYPTVSIDNLYQPYDGSPKTVTVTTLPAGALHTVTYNGSSTPPVDPGSYAVTATATYFGGEGSASGTLTIGKGVATVDLSDLHQTYDGSPKPASVSTTPSGLTYSTTYNGSAVIPTTAGTYTVVATIDDANYRGTTTGTLTIDKASAAISLGTLNFLYDGTPKPVSVTTSPEGLSGLTVTYDGSETPPTNAGSHQVVASLDNPNFVAPDAGGTLVIEEATGVADGDIPLMGPLGYGVWATLVAAAGARRARRKRKGA